jgi:hypothetical protein
VLEASATPDMPCTFAPDSFNSRYLLETRPVPIVGGLRLVRRIFAALACKKYGWEESPLGM